MKIVNSNKILQLRQFFESSVDNYPDNTAIICDNAILSYQDMEWRANQLANYLISCNINENSTVGILLERSLDSYISILAVLKTGAAYVPIETEYPDDRINYILSDTNFHSVITSSTQLDRRNINFMNPITLDQLNDKISLQSNHRPALSPTYNDHLCYIIYTSGSTGRPKGVEITQRNICHYVSVASKLYEITPQDKIYQGFSLAFDASLEECWMAFANAGTLVACTSKDVRSGLGLIQFLKKHKVTVFSTVPTLLSSLEGNLPDLRLLILGGEACTSNLIQRWSRSGLRILNTYGPTETTVIATYSDCYSDQPVTIGKPIEGYIAVILDENLQPVMDGQQGELCIGGLGVAKGYLNQPDSTAIKFIKHPINPSQCLYRTGDLAMIDSNSDIVFLGRIDDQIKLRGFRIELNEIESVIMENQAINQAIVSLQELDSPTLIAYLLIDSAIEFNLQAFKTALQQRLPHYMMPAHFELVDSFPLLSSGKVNRKALPKPQKVVATAYIAPETELEIQLSNLWEEGLQQRPISTEADFFYDLGGHSLSAAKIVSNLRKIPDLHNISILDLYQNPTIKQLAKKFSQHPSHSNNTEKTTKKNQTGGLSFYLCSIGQFFGCLLQYAIQSWQLLAIVLCYTWATKSHLSSSGEMLLSFLLLFLGMPIASLMITIGAKWLLVGRIKPGTYKLWGWFYFRWWLVERLQKNIFSPKYLIGSPLINVYYRLLGAKIGKNCFIGSASVAIHDLLTIGDNCSVGYDARLLGYVVEDGWLKIGSITIGEKCFIGARSVVSIDTIIHDNSVLDDMSMLPRHAVIPANQFFCGSPACRSIVPADHITQQIQVADNASLSKTFYFGLLHYVCLVFSMTLYYACFYPSIMLITHFHEHTHYLLTVFIAAPLGAILSLMLHYISIATCKKILIKKFKPGIYSIKSLYYLRQWTVVKMLDSDEIYVMADSLYLPHFMRFLGAKLGKSVEMGEAPHIIPDLITIHDEGFAASSVALAWPNVYQGCIRFAPAKIGKRAFLGNVSFLPLGAHVGDGGLLGCMSITPPNNQAADHHTSWLGSPAVFLPKREIVSGFSDSERFTPSRRLYNTRLGIEFLRIIAPTTFTLVALFNMLYVLNILLGDYSLLTTIFVLPVAELVIICALVTVIIGLKWLLLGKLKPATKPIWNIFIRKIDVIEYLYSYFVNNHFTNIVLGTPFASMLFRCLGAKIGKRVFIDTAEFAEFDLISIGNEACINAETLIDTHLYEDRIFKMSTIDIHEGCNVGVASIVLYNTIMEKNSTLGNLSLLMKGETLPANTRWQGVPAQPVYSHHVEPLSVLENQATPQPLTLELN